MKDIKRNYWNPARTAQGRLLCSGCPFLGDYTPGHKKCSLGREIRSMKVNEEFVPSSEACNLQNVTWTVLVDKEPDISVEQTTG